MLKLQRWTYADMKRGAHFKFADVVPGYLEAATLAEFALTG
jgi:hypothetical protein